MTTKKFFCLFLFSAIISIPIAAQNITSATTAKDSVLAESSEHWLGFRQKVATITNSRAFQMTYVGVPLIISGLIVKSEDDHFRYLRNSYISNFNNHYDDFLQYSPAVAMLALKTAGVESRSSWPRMLVSGLFSAGIMAAAVNSIKYTTKVMRPDGSTRNSFPSGHSATALMTATLLHKEYGMTRSPWYSFAGYSVAITTAVSRMMNNRHWLSDVMVGSGIGVMSAETGYLLADMIFKDKGITHNNVSYEDYDINLPPSFFGMSLGFNLMPTHFELWPDVTLKATPGSKMVLEGAWFKNLFFGIGGQVSAFSMPLSLTHQIPAITLSDNKTYQINSLESDPLNMISVYAGPYVSWPLTDQCLIGAKMLGGVSYLPSNRLYASYENVSEAFSGKQLIARSRHNYSPGIETGISFSYIIKPKFCVRTFLNYNIVPNRFVTFLIDQDKAFKRYERHRVLQSYTIGASVNMMFW